MEYYAEQLDGITGLIKALNVWEESPVAKDLLVKSPITLVHPEDPDEILGHLVDEIGGVWSFRPHKYKEEA